MKKIIQNPPKGSFRSAIIGLGRIGSTLEDDPLREKPASHAGAISALPELCSLVGGADIDPEKRNAFSRRWGCPVFLSPDTLVKETRPHVLHIATPPETHEALVREAAAKAVPVVVCEKPLAPDTAAGERMVAACRESGTRLLVNHERRYSADYRFVRDCLRDRRFGEIRSVSARVYMGENRKPGTMLYDDGTHMLNILRFLLEVELELVHIHGDPSLQGGSLTVLLSAGDIPVIIEVGAGREQIEFEVDISFSHGRIRIGNGVLEAFESRPSPYYSGMSSLTSVPVPEIRDKGYFTGIVMDALSLVEGKGAPESSGEDGLAVLRLMDAILGK